MSSCKYISVEANIIAFKVDIVLPDGWDEMNEEHRKLRVTKEAWEQGLELLRETDSHMFMTLVHTSKGDIFWTARGETLETRLSIDEVIKHPKVYLALKGLLESAEDPDDNDFDDE